MAEVTISYKHFSQNAKGECAILDVFIDIRTINNEFLTVHMDRDASGSHHLVQRLEIAVTANLPQVPEKGEEIPEVSGRSQNQDRPPSQVQQEFLYNAHARDSTGGERTIFT